MTEVAQWEPPTTAVAPTQNITNNAVHNLLQWAEHAGQVYRLAEMLCGSSFVPVAFKGKPVEGAAAIMAGAEVGLSPMTSLRAFDVIQGQAAPRAITLRAIVQSFGHEVEILESTETRCRIRGRRKGSEKWQEAMWTMDRARALQLAGKDSWKKQPGAMLVARATSEICRLIAADAIMGIGYTAEEISDGATPESVYQPVTEQSDAPATGTRRMSRKPRPDTAPDGVDVSTGEVASVTPEQLKKLHASFGDVGIGSREAGIAYCVNVIGREIESTKDLTKGEASKVIDHLEADLVDASRDADDYGADDPMDGLPLGGQS